MASHRHWWLCGHHRPIARLIPTTSDFPWHYFRLQPFPQYRRYASLFAREDDLCRYAFPEFAGTHQFPLPLKESAKKSGALPTGSCRRSTDMVRPEARIPAAHGGVPLVIEDLRSHLEQQMSTRRCPLHLLLLDHPFAHHLVDR
jgi:hypothetical protein